MAGDVPARWLVPDWPAPTQVRAVMTTREGGVSTAPFTSFNLATHVGDAPLAVVENRARLRRYLPAEPLWLNQVHGTAVAEVGREMLMHDAMECIGDASVAFAPAQVCAVMTADCLPVLCCDRAGTVVAAAHAGWRGLAAGVLEATIAKMGIDPGQILAWLGAAIGPQQFEVGPEVEAAFVAQHPAAAMAFKPRADAAPGSDRRLCDIYALAQIRLAACGVTAVYGGDRCTVSDSAQFYSYRRDGRTGRMASLIWLEPA